MTKKNYDIISKMNMFFNISAATATFVLAGWLIYSSSQNVIDDMKGYTSWKKYQDGNTKNWKQSQYIDAILSAPGIRSRANRYAVLCIQKEINEVRFQNDQRPIEECGILNQETLKGLIHLPIENLENILNKEELGISNGYNYQMLQWEKRKQHQKE